MPCGGKAQAQSIRGALGQHPSAFQFFGAGTGADAGRACGSKVLRSNAGATVDALEAGIAACRVTGSLVSFCGGTGLVATAAPLGFCGTAVASFFLSSALSA